MRVGARRSVECSISHCCCLRQSCAARKPKRNREGCERCRVPRSPVDKQSSGGRRGARGASERGAHFRCESRNLNVDCFGKKNFFVFPVRGGSWIDDARQGSLKSRLIIIIRRCFGLECHRRDHRRQRKSKTLNGPTMEKRARVVRSLAPITD